MAESLALKGLPKEKKQDLILDTTIHCMAEHGYNQITLELIAEKVGVSKGTLSYYFKSKDDLIAEALVFGGNRILGGLEETISNYDTPVDKIRAGLTMLWKEFSSNHGIIRFYYDLLAQALFSERFRVLQADLTRNFRTLFRDILSEGENGSRDSEEIILIKTAMLSCLIDGIVKQVILDPEAFEGVDTESGMKYLIEKICESV